MIRISHSSTLLDALQLISILELIFALDLHLGYRFDLLLELLKTQGNQSRSMYFCLLLQNMALTLALTHNYWLWFMAMALDLVYGSLVPSSHNLLIDSLLYNIQI
jgi:hypothetical protein